MQTKQRLDITLNLKSVSDSGEFEGYGFVLVLRRLMVVQLLPRHSRNGAKKGAACVALAAPHDKPIGVHRNERR